MQWTARRAQARMKKIVGSDHRTSEPLRKFVSSIHMNVDDTRKRLLVYAVERLGRVETAKRLNISLELLHGWMRGVAEPSSKVLLALADLVYEMQKPAGAK